MASFHDVTNEKSGTFEEAAYDPDLEARLYAEIYYSNDNYQEDYNSSLENSQNLDAESNLASQRKENFVVDLNVSETNERFDKSAEQRTIYPSRSWVLGEQSKDARCDFAQKSSGPKIVKRSRLLAQKDLWLPRHEQKTQRQFARASKENTDNFEVENRRDKGAISIPVVGGSIEADNIGGCSNKARNTSEPFGSGAVEAGDNLEQCGSGAIEAGNITEENCNDEVGNLEQFQSGADEAENIRKVESRADKTRNICKQFGSGSIVAENITPAIGRSKRIRNFTAQLERDSNCTENIFTPIESGSIETGIFFTRFGRDLIDTENNRRFVNRSKNIADVSNRFVAESFAQADNPEVDADFTDDATIFMRSDGRLTNFEIIDEIISRDCSRMRKGLPSGAGTVARALSKKDEKFQRRKLRKAEMRKKKRQLLESSRSHNNDCLNVNTSKYKVISKKNKQNMRQIETEPVDISSDSDDSILEVPVPPKTPPPIIQLQDSDDECEKAKKSPSKRRKKSADESREDSTPSSSPEKHSSNPVETSSTNLQEVLSEPAKNLGDTWNIQSQDEHEDDNGKTSKTRSKKGKKTTEELPENEESNETQIDETRPTNSSKDPRDKSKNAETSNIESHQECENDSGKSGKSRCKKGKKSAEESQEESVSTQNVEADSSKDCESSEAQIRETDLQKIVKEASKKTKNLENVTINISEDNNLILNCTEIQKGASSLDEIRKMRETVTIINAHSDDSMTESEANNWVNIAAGQKNSIREDEEIRVIGSTDQINTALWDQLTGEKETASTAAFNEIGESSGQTNLTTQKASKTIEVVSDVSPVNSRKRQKESSTFVDFDVPAIPEKRAKNKHKTSREQTMNEYFFKPMSKELQAFYNNPCGGENLDMYEIQSRMPRNPNCWAILDADLQGPISKRRKLCPRCKTDNHFGRKCPEKAKPPCCYMCGTKGHTESRCPHTMCLTCGRKYATYRPTCGYCSQLFCSMCNGAGHSRETCPDLWRRYHSTTTETMPVKPRDASTIMKPNHNLTCCNCAKRGHDVTTCRQLRWSQHFPTPMYISSYTEGPTYELSNHDRTQETYQDFTNDLPQNERYYDTDINSFPIHNRMEANDLSMHDTSNLNIHESCHSENSKERNSIENIEVIEIPDNTPAPLMPMPAVRVLFRIGELDIRKTGNGWSRVTKRLDTLKDIDLTGLLSGNLKPTFLIPLQTYFEFGVEIVESNAAGIVMTIQCRNKVIFKDFENVIWQWLSRKDVEKKYLVYDKIPYENNNIVINEMKMKLVLIRTVLQPNILMKKIVSCDKMLGQLNANLKTTMTKKNKRRKTALASASETSSSRRCQLVASLYSGNWVDGGAAIVHKFRQLARERLRLSNLGKLLPIREYLQLVFTYNEIFVFHESEALKRALEKALASLKQTESMDSQAKNDDDFAYPSAEVTDGQNLIVEKSDLAPLTGQTLPNEAEGSLGEINRLPANSADYCVSNEPQSSAESQILNESYTPIFHQSTAVNEKTSMKQAKKKKNKKKPSQGLLQSLKRSRRKLYQRTARDAIKLAIDSNEPRLKEMANIVEAKMADGTLITDQIDVLQQAISADLRNRSSGGGVMNIGKQTLKRFRGTRRLRQQQTHEMIQRMFHF